MPRSHTTSSLLLDDRKVIEQAYPDIDMATDEWIRLKLTVKALRIELARGRT